MRHLIALLMLLPPLALAIEAVTPTALAQLVQGGALVVDVRSPEEFAAGHVPGAINVPHGQILADSEVLARYRDRPLVLYCRSGRRVGLAAERLEPAGFTLYHLQGDMLGWEQSGMPLARGAATDCRNC